jgi:hypothetical protein
MPAPKRHHHVIRFICEFTGANYVDDMQQGFLDETGKFLNRKEALAVALESNQVSAAVVRAGKLFSEDIW